MRRAAELELATLRLEQSERVLLARFSDPPFNFMSARLLDDLDMLTRAVEQDFSVGSVVLTGAGTDRFITHFDVGELLAGSERAGASFHEAVARWGVRALEAVQRLPGGEWAVRTLPVGGALTMRRFVAIASRIRRSGVVYLAAISGPCGGGGLELALSFDLRVAAQSSVLLLPELLIGLTTSVGGQRLAELVGPARALEMALEGRPLDAATALATGLVNEVAPAEALVETTCARARRYASRNRATVAAQKRIFFEHSVRSPTDSLRHEAAASLAAATSERTRRALRVFVRAQRRAGGESPFLADLEPWADGRAVTFEA